MRELILLIITSLMALMYVVALVSWLIDRRHDNDTERRFR